MTIIKKANEYFKNKNYEEACKLYIKAKSEYGFEFLNVQIDMCLKKSGNNKELTKKTSTQDIQVSNKIDNNLVEGRIESFNNFVLLGWLVSKKDSEKVISIEVLIDNVHFLEVKNTIIRNDLKRHNKSKGKGGFRIEIPKLLLNKEEHIISIRVDNSIAYYKYIQVPNLKINNCTIRRYPKHSISVIVPIYNAAEDLKICIDRIIKYTNSKVDIILINDASTDITIDTILNEAKKNINIRVFKNKDNLGFTKTVNKGIQLAGNNDVVLLNSDARVTPRWLEGLKYALLQDDRIATVTPMSDRAGAFSAPSIGNDNDLPTNINEVDYAVAFRRTSLGLYPTVPTGNGFCMYIRRTCIDEIGSLDEEAFPRGYGEENDFCMRARKNGWRNIIDDRTYIFHDRQKSFLGAKDSLIKEGRAVVDNRYPDYKKAISIFSESPLIAAARFKAKEALQICEQKLSLTRALFVISTLTGGTPQTNRDLMLALTDSLEPWLLHCDSKVITLYKVFKNKTDEIVEQYFLKEQIEPLTHTSAEYDSVVSNWLYRYDFEVVHIRHLAWHSLSLPKLAKEAGSRVINSFHDFYTICPTVKLLDGNNVFCDGTCTKTDNICKPDLWQKDAFPLLKNSWIKIWREKFEKSLKYCDAYITTHKSVRNTILQHLNIKDDNFYVIPHGRDFNEFYSLAKPYKNNEILKIIVPGNISEPKGSLLIQELLELDKNEKLHFYILGRTNIKFTHPRLTIYGEYKREDFSKHVESIEPHIGAVFSTWNETWCHTLTELWSVGIPVITTDYETLKDRMISSSAGWYFSDKNIKKLYSYLINKVSDEKNIKEATIKTLKFQKSNLKIYQNQEMAQEYLRVYKIKD